MEDAAHRMSKVIEYLSQPFPDDQNPSPHARLVLLALASYQARGDARPGIYTLENLERLTQLSRQTIQRHLRQWEARGVLKPWQVRWGHETADEFAFFPDGVVPGLPWL